MSTPLPVFDKTLVCASGLEIRGDTSGEYSEILSPGALEFFSILESRFRERRKALLKRRKMIQKGIDLGARPDFLPDTFDVRSAFWKIAPVPQDLEDRRVEITGPVDRKMIINALNSGANAFMADFEDSTSPTWANVIEGQINLRDAVRREISYVAPRTGKRYRLGANPATLIVRPRGWHLPEKNVFLDGEPVSAAIFDFALYFYHNVRTLLANGTGPYFYLPKLENHLEARLWNDIFVEAQDLLGVAQGTIKATVLIETVLAAFEMDEILYELRDHSAGLNCGRWDYIFSFIKKFGKDPQYVLPDRGFITMEKRFLESYSLLLIQTCHRRGAHAMGGMAAQIPIKSDPLENERALEKVVADKRREAGNGHDGTWVAHPGLIQAARRELDAVLEGPHQIANRREDVWVTASDLLEVPDGPVTLEGLKHNIRVGIEYLEAWLRGSGCVPLYDLMEDAATCEICRAQVWQWIRHRVTLDNGRRVDRFLVGEIIQSELTAITRRIGDIGYERGRFDLAAEIFERQVVAPELDDFLTLSAYPYL